MRLQRQALWVWYRGHAFHGFQWQKDGRSVQQALEEGFRAVGVGASPMGAGRTDRGVHARMQVVLLKTSKQVDLDALVQATNEALGEHGGVALTKPAADSFHPQWSAAGKEYRYRLWLKEGAAPEHCWDVRTHERLSSAAVDQARFAEVIRGLQRTADFSALHAKGSVRKPRTIERAQVVERADGIVEVRLSGDSFAKYQVRILVGTAALVAAGVLEPAALEAALTDQRPIEGLVAPPGGLILWDVRYREAVDPFTAEERERAPFVPRTAPFD